MPFKCADVLAWGAYWVLSCLPVVASQNALIIIGTTGSPSVTTELTSAAQDIHDGLIQRGFAPDAVEIIKARTPDDKVTTDLILQSLKKRQTLAATDELWVILLGFSGHGEEGVPTFQVSGPRLTAPNLKLALDAIPARQFVVIGTSDSGSFIPILLTKNRSVLAATREEGEIDLPRFPENWAAALKENPRADWKALAARAAELTEKEYADNNLAESEHARLGDPETGEILEAPFGVDASEPAAVKPEPDGSMALINAADIKVEIRKPNAEWEKQDATDETKKLIEAACATPNPEGFASLLLEQRLGYRIGEDRTAEDFVMQRIYIAKEDGVARWANFRLPQDPPAATTKLIAARIIQPDGSCTVFNPAKMPPATDCTSGLCGALMVVFMPGTHAGCLIEIAYRTRHLLDASVPEFSEELPVQQDIPVLKTELQLQIPEKMGLHFKLRNSDQKPADSTADGLRTLTWKLPEMTAYEALPYDPPERDMLTALDVTSLGSWDDFAAWYRRLTSGSDAQDPAVQAKAEELEGGATGRMDKIRKVYEFVSAMRYVAIEFGINGIRPRPPAVVLQNNYGDCKDKANLLVALLADMGIDGRFCLLNRGSSTDVSFPSWQFNHAIAYVPKAPDAGQPDDLWLDTTDSTAPFPTLSPGDIGRSALVFDKDSAQFLTVAEAGKDVTDIQEHWHFLIVSTGAKCWSGEVEKSWTGLADYTVRSTLRGLSPIQRDFELASEWGKQLPNSDFTEFATTPVDDLTQPMQIKAAVSSAYPPAPAPGFDVAAYFAAKERDRPLLINNGQKLHLIQTVDLPDSSDGPSTPNQSPFDSQTAGIHATIKWDRSDNHAWRRTAELTVDQPLVAQADYREVRGMLLGWVGQLTR